MIGFARMAFNLALVPRGAATGRRLEGSAAGRAVTHGRGARSARANPSACGGPSNSGSARAVLRGKTLMWTTFFRGVFWGLGVPLIWFLSAADPPQRISEWPGATREYSLPPPRSGRYSS